MHHKLLITNVEKIKITKILFLFEILIYKNKEDNKKIICVVGAKYSKISKLKKFREQSLNVTCELRISFCYKLFIEK